MGRLNVFSKENYYSWKCPLKNMRLFCCNVKYAWQRVTQGYCNRDVWNLDSYYLNLFHATLLHLAEHHMGYPGTEPFEEDEKWTEFLYDLSIKFYQANEENDCLPHPMADKWWEDVKANGNFDVLKYESPYAKPMCDEERENWEKRQAIFEDAWARMGENFHRLWD